jgi:hypothetical protein
VTTALTETADIRLTAGIATWPVPVIAIPFVCFLGLSVQLALIKKKKKAKEPQFAAAVRHGRPRVPAVSLNFVGREPGFESWQKLWRRISTETRHGNFVFRTVDVLPHGMAALRFRLDKGHCRVQSQHSLTLLFSFLLNALCRAMGRRRTAARSAGAR